MLFVKVVYLLSPLSVVCIIEHMEDSCFVASLGTPVNMGKDFVAIFLQPTENKCYQVFVYSNEVVRAQKFPYLRAHRKPLDSTNCQC
uniref:Putative secreted protein n=1 Tax=Ixodes scapularis TaxID=6945 RepID=A0A4D5S6P3_IXOSC